MGHHASFLNPIQILFLEHKIRQTLTIHCIPTAHLYINAVFCVGIVMMPIRIRIRIRRSRSGLKTMQIPMRILYILYMLENHNIFFIFCHSIASLQCLSFSCARIYELFRLLVRDTDPDQDPAKNANPTQSKSGSTTLHKCANTFGQIVPKKSLP